jgi:3-hydroxyanthranilate 3,4-dioxygenase
VACFVAAARFIGGPNTREDYHLDLGSEFFFQMKGNMELPTIQQGKRKLVKINQGQVYLLPSRIPHSPQRQVDTFGLVVERKRAPDEVDGLRWYRDFEQPDTSCTGGATGSAHPHGVLWDRFFYCGDLEKDLVPVVKAYKSSPECNDVRTSERFASERFICNMHTSPSPSPSPAALLALALALALLLILVLILVLYCAVLCCVAGPALPCPALHAACSS